MAKHKHSEKQEEDMFAVRSTIKDFNRNAGVLGGFGKGKFRQQKKKLKKIVKECPEAYSGAPSSWFR